MDDQPKKCHLIVALKLILATSGFVSVGLQNNYRAVRIVHISASPQWHSVVTGEQQVRKRNVTVWRPSVCSVGILTFGAQRIAQGKDFELILTVIMETRHID